MRSNNSANKEKSQKSPIVQDHILKANRMSQKRSKSRKKSTTGPYGLNLERQNITDHA